MEDGIVEVGIDTEIMKFEDGTWVLYGNGKEPLALNTSASQALDFAISYGVQRGLEQYLAEVRKEYTDKKSLLEAEEDYYYILDICKTESFVDIKTQF